MNTLISLLDLIRDWRVSSMFPMTRMVSMETIKKMEKCISKVDKDGKVDNHSWSWYGRFVKLTKN